MQVPREDSQISWINHHDQWNPNGQREGQSHQRMARTKKPKGSTNLPRICKLLLKIHTRVLTDMYTFN